MNETDPEFFLIDEDDYCDVLEKLAERGPPLQNFALEIVEEGEPGRKRQKTENQNGNERIRRNSFGKSASRCENYLFQPKFKMFRNCKLDCRGMGRSQV